MPLLKNFPEEFMDADNFLSSTPEWWWEETLAFLSGQPPSQFIITERCLGGGAKLQWPHNSCQLGDLKCCYQPRQSRFTDTNAGLSALEMEAWISKIRDWLWAERNWHTPPLFFFLTFPQKGTSLELSWCWHKGVKAGGLIGKGNPRKILTHLTRAFKTAVQILPVKHGKEGAIVIKRPLTHMQRLLNLAQASWHLGFPWRRPHSPWDTADRTHSSEWWEFLGGI